MFAGFIGLLAAASAGNATRTGKDIEYFPGTFGNVSYACRSFRGTRPDAVLPSWERKRYSGLLSAAGEPSLYRAASHSGPALAKTVRFLWVRSFEPPMIVRIERHAGAAAVMVATELTGIGVEPPGKIRRHVRQTLSAADMTAFNAALQGLRARPVAPKECLEGIKLDGSQWIIEAADRSGYSYFERWSPSDGPMRALGVTMLRLTGWQVGEIY